MPEGIKYIQYAPIKGLDVSVPEERQDPLTSPDLANVEVIDGALEGRLGYSEHLASFPNSSNEIMEGVQYGDSAGTLHLLFCDKVKLTERTTGPDAWTDRSAAISMTGDASNPIFMVPVGGLSTDKLYISNGVDPIKQWSAGLSWTDLSLTGFSTLLAKCMIGFKGSLVLGDFTADGTHRPYGIRWSDQSDPTTWNGVTAGTLNLIEDEENSKVQTLIPLKDALIAYKEKAIYSLNYKGGRGGIYFAATQVISDDGAISRKAVAHIPDLDAHLVVTTGRNIKLFDGFNFRKRSKGKHIGNRIKKKFFSELNWANRGKIYVKDIPEKSSVIILMPNGASTVPDRAYIWNYQEDAWFISDYNDAAYSITYADIFFSTIKQMLNISGNVFELDNGNDDNGNAIDRNWRTRLHHFGGLDPELIDKRMTCTRVEFDTSGTFMDAEVSGVNNSEDSPSFSSVTAISDEPATGTARIATKASGTYLTLKVSKNSTDAPGRIAKYAMFLSEGGR